MTAHEDQIVVEVEDGPPLYRTERVYGALGLLLAALVAFIVLIAIIVELVD